MNTVVCVSPAVNETKLEESSLTDTVFILSLNPPKIEARGNENGDFEKKKTWEKVILDSFWNKFLPFPFSVSFKSIGIKIRKERGRSSQKIKRFPENIDGTFNEGILSLLLFLF